jgi:hypothetical protein
MTKNIQYQILSYKPFLWWNIATVHFWIFDTEQPRYDGAEWQRRVRYFWFFHRRQPDFVRGYIAKDMKKKNTRLRWEQRFLMAKDD